MKRSLLGIVAALAIIFGSEGQVPSTAIRNFATTSVLTTTTLGSNAVYTSSWFDASSTGQKSLELAAASDQGGSFIIQTSNNTADTNMTSTLGCSPSSSSATCSNGIYTVAAASLLKTGTIYLSEQCWRIVYTNGSVAQTRFDIAATAAQMPRDVVTSGSVGLTRGNVSILGSASATACTSLSTIASPAVVLDNVGPATTVFPEFYDEGASPTCATADLIFGDGATITLGPAAIITLYQGVRKGLAYKLSGALTTNLEVGW